ncbi:hypothetical protein NDU88_001726 [Pleurodeles waltl]|uniref:Peptidase A2 domain-containing protein n=1 Tax=Pleurodeles waltl TaxID=8319 RepID=A0AAV7UVI7_PLEWA|nr:hypothetical protein NDU88_001726 [Pleurodeles waltl]
MLLLRLRYPLTIQQRMSCHRQTCKGCGKFGHFLKVCKSSHVKKVFKVEEYKTDEDSDNSEMMEKLVLLVAIISKEYLHNQPKCNIHVNGESVKMLVDTGSRITILSKNTYETLECKALLQASKIIPGAYGGHKIKLEGVFKADLKFKNKNTSSKVFVVDYNVNILGWLEQQSLRMLINPCQPPYVFSIQEDNLENTLEEYKEIFRGKLECLKNFKHKIILKEDVQPVKQRVRNIPLSARSEVKDILKSWCDEGIIEPINASEWLSPMALAKKRNGSIRLCIDLRQLNNHVVADCQSLALINEMVMTLDQNYATKVEPLRKLTKKDAEFIWDEICEESMKNINKELQLAPSLQSFSEKLQSIVTTDAIQVGLGAVQSQRVAKEEKSIAFASRQTERS